MKIEEYGFGKIVINGQTYGGDVMIFPDGRIDDRWWRSKGHVLTVDDIFALISSKPDIIIAGTGASGRMQPEKGLTESLSGKGIDFRAIPTKEAVALFNRKAMEARVAACLHLSC